MSYRDRRAEGRLPRTVAAPQLGIAELRLGLALNRSRRQVSGEEKLLAIETLLLLDAEQPDRAIAAAASGRNPAVGEVRSQLEPKGQVETSLVSPPQELQGEPQELERVVGEGGR